MQSNSKPIPRTWRHYKRGRKELIIIGSFGNHEDWPLAQLVKYLPFSKVLILQAYNCFTKIDARYSRRHI